MRLFEGMPPKEYRTYTELEDDVKRWLQDNGINYYELSFTNAIITGELYGWITYDDDRIHFQPKDEVPTPKPWWNSCLKTCCCLL